MRIENIVFKGGGVLGIAYVGVIQALKEEKILDNVKGVAGTSAGAIIALFLSLRYTVFEIKYIATATDWKKFTDNYDTSRVTSTYGLYKGDYLLYWIKNIIKKKTNNENITFLELSKQGYRNLKVFATDLNTSEAKEFSSEKTPNVIVAESIRASISIPLFFSAWKFPKANPNNHLYVDGGVINNYPIKAFKNSSTTLGFYLLNNERTIGNIENDNILKYIEALLTAWSTKQDKNFKKSNDQKNTVEIDSFGISTTDFKITIYDIIKLYRSGLQATKKWLEIHRSSFKN